MTATEPPRFYAWIDGAGASVPVGLGPRQKAWIDGRMNYLGLVYSNRVLDVDLRANDITWTSRALASDAEPAGEVAHVTLEVPPENAPPESAPRARSLQGRLRQRLARLNPVAADEIRQRELWVRLRLAERRSSPIAPIGVEAGSSPQSTQPVALVGMYWFEIGGAERWAFRSIEILRAEGILPVVVVDAPSAHRLITTESLYGCVVIVADREDLVAGEAMVRALLARLRLAGVLLHHSHLLYALLPLILALQPGVPVADSLHVVEWEDGGFPLVSSRYGGMIGTRHAISVPLAEYLAARPGVDGSSVVVAPLLSLGTPPAELAPSRARAHDGFVIGFVGRLVDQKRPYLVLETLRRLRGDDTRYRALIHGDGPNLAQLHSLTERWGLIDVVEFRSSTVPVAETYRDMDVLLIPSQIEGLTLTAMEATAADVAVISADVGAQRSLVAPGALLPRHPGAFARAAVRLIRSLASDPSLAESLVARQRQKSHELSQIPDAEVWMTGLAARWAASK